MRKCCYKPPNCVEVNSTIESDEQKIADYFNKCFTSIAKKLTTQIPPPNQQKFSFKNLKTENYFFFNPTIISQIKRIISRFKPKNSFGLDAFPAKLLRGITRISRRNFSVYLQQVFCDWYIYRSIQEAKVIPIYKKGNPLRLQNYRPISLLSASS